jgi:hypothetical protein
MMNPLATDDADLITIKDLALKYAESDGPTLEIPCRHFRDSLRTLEPCCHYGRRLPAPSVGTRQADRVVIGFVIPPTSQW